VPLDVLDVVQLGGERVENVDDDDFPVGLALIEKSHNTEDLDLLDLANVANLLADLADVEGVVVAAGLGLSVGRSRVLPGLGEIRLDPASAIGTEEGGGSAPGGKHHSSRCNRGGGSSCEQSAACPS